MNGATENIGVVAIGRNEGESLRRCLESVTGDGRVVVYVDSGSTDGSVELAQTMGVRTVRLDPAELFTAAKARNAGYARLVEIEPASRYVQFVDGDCEVNPGWISDAARFLESRADAAAVCGRRRERFPLASIYNRLCDVEWNTPVGEADACGGDAMMRVEAYRAVGGFNAGMIAGEEPELCVRLRSAGWTIHRIDAEMTLHDARMTRFGQWWRRSVRAGFAFAAGSSMHGASSSHWLRQTVRTWVWALVLPVLMLALIAPTRGWSLLIIGLYALQLYRAAAHRRSRGEDWEIALIYGGFCVIGKWAEFVGQIRFWASKLARRQAKLIEYKSAAVADGRIVGHSVTGQ